MKKQLPTFLGIGAHKAGSTWLFSQLRSHPEIWLPVVKELHFFDRASRYPSPDNLATSSPARRLVKPNAAYRREFAKSLATMVSQIREGQYQASMWHFRWLFGYYDEDWYTALFRPGLDYPACGEITPAYSILDTDDVERIKTVNPGMKFIFMVRNPIERAWSAMRFNTDRGIFEFGLDDEDKIIGAMKGQGFVLRGDYERTIANFLTHFDSSQVLVCYFDAIKQDTIGLMAAITDFLGVSRFDNDTINNQLIVNPSTSRQMPPSVRDYLVSVYEPMIHRFARKYGSYAVDWEKSLRGEGTPARSNTSTTATFHP